MTIQLNRKKENEVFIKEGDTASLKTVDLDLSVLILLTTLLANEINEEHEIKANNEVIKRSYT